MFFRPLHIAALVVISCTFFVAAADIRLTPGHYGGQAGIKSTDQASHSVDTQMQTGQHPLSPVIITLRHFGAVCDGKHPIEDTLAFSAAMNAMASGGKLLVPPGDCNLHTPISVPSNVHIVGAGREVSRIWQNCAHADTFDFSNAGEASLAHISLNGLKKTGGFGVRVSHGSAVRINDVRFTGLYVGVGTSNTQVSGVVWLRDTDFAHIVSDSILIDGISQFFADAVTSYSAGENCLHITAAGGLYAHNVTCMATRLNGLLVNPAQGRLVSDLFLSNFEADDSQDDGIVFDSTKGGVIVDAKLTNVRSAFNNGSGLLLKGPETSSINIVNFSAIRNIGHGIDVEGGYRILFSTGQVLGNSSVRVGYQGIFVNGGSVIDINHMISSSQYPGQSDSNAEYGVVLTSKFSGTIKIKDGFFQNNKRGGILNNSASTHVVISDNLE